VNGGSFIEFATCPATYCSSEISGEYKVERISGTPLQNKKHQDIQKSHSFEN